MESKKPVSVDKFTKAKISEGDYIKISALGTTLEGTVISASNWGDSDGWYIEFDSTRVGYSYWKQGMDGGKIVEWVKK